MSMVYFSSTRIIIYKDRFVKIAFPFKSAVLMNPTGRDTNSKQSATLMIER